MFCSLYLYVGEGIDGRNCDLLRSVGRLLRTIGQPFIISGDFQVHPQILERSGLAAEFRGVVVRPGQITYASGAAESEIDYFIISECLKPMVVSCYSKRHPSVSKHFVVLLELDGTNRSRRVQSIRKPKRIDACVPVGPVPPPPVIPASLSTRAIALRAREDVDDFYGEFRAIITQEVIDVLQLGNQVTVESLTRPFKIVWKSALPRTTSQPACGPVGSMWRYFTHKAYAVGWALYVIAYITLGTMFMDLSS